MNRAYSNKSVGFLRFIIFTAAFCILAFKPVTAKAAAPPEPQEGSIEAVVLDEQEPLPEAKLNLRYVSLVKGNGYALKVYNLTDTQTVVFKSDNEEIVFVDENGLITGIEYGTAVVTAYVKEDSKTTIKLLCDVTVGAAAVNVTLTHKEYTLAVNEKFILKTILEPFNTVEEPKFFSSEPSIATVSAAGRVTAKSEGTVTIYVLIVNKGRYDTCVFTVTPAVEEPDNTYTEAGNPTNAVQTETE